MLAAGTEAAGLDGGVGRGGGVVWIVAAEGWGATGAGGGGGAGATGVGAGAAATGAGAAAGLAAAGAPPNSTECKSNEWMFAQNSKIIVYSSYQHC